MTSLSIEILEQPTRYHRFRYEKEVSGGKLGGLLYGRSEKSCVRVRVSNIDPLMQKSVTVIGGTVSPDLYPHPFFMVGDDCRSGTFQLKKDTDSLGGKTEFEISLEKVSLVCVLLRPPDKLQEAVNRRLAINFNPFNKDLTSMSSMYTARNLKPLRLAFQIFVTDYNDVTAPTSAAVYSEEIYDYKQEPRLGLYDLHPELIRSQFSVFLVEDHNEHDNDLDHQPEAKRLRESDVVNPQIPNIKRGSCSSRSPAAAGSTGCSSERLSGTGCLQFWLHISNCPAHLAAPTRREMLSFHNLVYS
uniref:RHD domain-containing protein n=1 Tax=Macrostomum lignano TaxID=282301 RepID=A0A1I8IVL2_9PLAT